MASYRVLIKPSASKELDKLAGPVIARIVPRLEQLAAQPRPAGCKKLTGGDREWRIRVGDYRVLYDIADTVRIVRVFRVRHRREVYR